MNTTDTNSRHHRRRAGTLRSAAAALLAAGAAALATGCAGTDATPLDDPAGVHGKTYAVVVSKPTAADPEWAKVVELLRKKHDAVVIVHDAPAVSATPAPPPLLAVIGRTTGGTSAAQEAALESARVQLAKIMPARTAFVATPAECGRDYIAAVHRLTRRLDDDPWLDTAWGVITGATAGDALRLASAAEPLVVKTALATTSLNENLFDEYFLISDGDPGAWLWKKRDGSRETGKDDFGKPDAAVWGERLADAPDLVVTSFHGFENGVEMPFSRGIERVAGGRLYPLANPRLAAPPRGLRPIPDSPNPKVYFPVGNCLVGHVNSADCMVTAMTGRYGVRQMAGYTVNTWFGRGGWDMLGLWQTLPGRLSFAESFFLNQQRMLHDIAALDPRGLEYKIPLGEGEVRIPTHIRAMLDAGLRFDPRRMRGGSGKRDDDRQLAGLLWDIDTVAFYGDPAWRAVLDAKKDPPFLRTTLTAKDGAHELRVTLLDPARARANSTPVGVIFTTRLKNPRVTAGADYKPVLADNFLLLLNPRPTGDETELVIRFTGDRTE
ncbi:MAG: hypothetical protein LBR07_07970 [Puniceicoccales bacterium]|jgi:zinc protease|nr:hypothetical protein [Puniceicoccales bacterium]